MILICKEYSIKQIADRLKISQETVKTHAKALKRKTGAATQVGVALFAVKNNLFVVVVICSLGC